MMETKAPVFVSWINTFARASKCEGFDGTAIASYIFHKSSASNGEARKDLSDNRTAMRMIRLDCVEAEGASIEHAIVQICAIQGMRMLCRRNVNETKEAYEGRVVGSEPAASVILSNADDSFVHHRST